MPQTMFGMSTGEKNGEWCPVVNVMVQGVSVGYWDGEVASSDGKDNGLSVGDWDGLMVSAGGEDVVGGVFASEGNG